MFGAPQSVRRCLVCWYRKKPSKPCVRPGIPEGGFATGWHGRDQELFQNKFLGFTCRLCQIDCLPDGSFSPLLVQVWVLPTYGSGTWTVLPLIKPKAATAESKVVTRGVDSMPRSHLWFSRPLEHKCTLLKLLNNIDNSRFKSSVVL